MVNFSVIRYIYNVSRCLPCPRKDKIRIIKQVYRNISAYTAENPSAVYYTLIERFGTPQQIACSYVEEQKTTEILSILRIKRKILAVVVTVAVAVVVMWSCVMAYEINYNKNLSNGYTIVTIENGVEKGVYDDQWRK